MHELSIAQAILDAAAEQSQRHGDARIAAIHLRLGELSGVVREALVSAFDVARKSSNHPQSRLVIEAVEVTAHCPACNEQRQVESIQSIRCRTCGTACSQVLSGRELEITAMEIE